MILPELKEDNVKSLEIIPRSLDGNITLFNLDFTMNDVESITYISNRDLISKVLFDCEKDTTLELSKDDFDCELLKDESYYIIANYNDTYKKLCSLVGILDVEDEVINLEYTRRPHKVDSVFRW